MEQQALYGGNVAPPISTIPTRTLREIRFTVFGEAKPQGSQQHRFVPSLGHTVAHEKHSLVDWRKQVAQVAGQHTGQAGIIEGPVALEVTFFRLRPKSARKRPYPTTAPDADKLVRAIGDAITGVLIRDDAQVVDLIARKRFGAVAGCDVVVREIE